MACPADGETTSTDAMNEPAPVTTVGDPEPVQTPEIPVTVMESEDDTTPPPTSDEQDNSEQPPAQDEEVMEMSEETGEIIELTIVMESEDDTTPPPTSDEQDNSEQPPAQDEEVMEMSEETGEIIELTIVMESEDDTTPPPTSDEDTDSDEQDNSPEPAEPMYETAPDFELPSVDGTNIRLSDYRDNPVVLVFYRSYFCSICRRQLTTLNRSYSEFQERNTEILAISSDRLDERTLKLIRDSSEAPEFPLLFTSLNPTVPLAYDRHGNVGDAGTGYFGLGGGELIDPGTFLINAGGQIVWKDLGAYTGDTVPAQTILNQIDNLPGS